MVFLLGGRLLTSRAAAVCRSMTTIKHCSSVTSGKKHVNGVDLYYEQRGTGKHALLLMPGALGTAQTDFAPQLKSLNKDRFTVVGWDPRGYGKSRPPQRDYPLTYYERDADDAVGLMKALGFDKFSLLGWSDGGMTSIIVAGKNPDLIKQLVVWGSNTYVSQEDAEIYEAVRHPTDWSEKMRQPMEEVYGKEGFAKLLSAWVDGIVGFVDKPEGSICVELLPHIRCPTLILHGEKDPIVPNFHPRYLIDNIKGSKLYLFPEGKHNVHIRYPDEFNKVVEDFLED